MEAKRTFVWNARRDLEHCTRDGNVEVARDGSVRLCKSVLFQDEQGLTHRNNTENLSAAVWARKQFVIDDPRCDEARLFVFGGSTKATCNGRALKRKTKLRSTGWVFWKVPPESLKKGLNEFVFSGGGSLLIESSLYPNRSAKSVDGGRTWDSDHLCCEGIEDGEYLVRLRLAQFPKQGWMVSEVVDLADHGSGVRPRTGVKDVRLSIKGKIPRNTGLSVAVRTGETPTPDVSWSAWQEAYPENRCRARWKRYVQWRAVLVSHDAGRTSELSRVAVEAVVDVQGAHAGGRPDVKVLELTPVSLRQRSYPFAHQPPGGRAGTLRERYELDRVVAEGKTELERLILLRNWARLSAPRGWNRGTAEWCPPWDALILLETNKKPIALCMCTHYSTIFVQCALALGYNARHVILDHHCVAEVWSNQFRKWIMIDTGGLKDVPLTCHYEKDDVPLNALEIRALWKAGKTDLIEAVYTPARIRADRAELKRQCKFENYRRFAIPFRNNHLVTPFPGELEQGQVQYFCDMYLWWEDKAVPTASPEYGKTSCRAADFYWTLNETLIDMQVTEAPNTLQVTLGTVTPNLSGFVVSIDGGKWEEKAASFTWKLRRGENELRVKSVNGFGVKGVESVARVACGG